MIELVHENFLKTIVTVFHMFRRLEERLSMLSRNKDDIKKGPNQTSRDENCNV